MVHNLTVWFEYKHEWYHPANNFVWIWRLFKPLQFFPFFLLCYHSLPVLPDLQILCILVISVAKPPLSYLQPQVLWTTLPDLIITMSTFYNLLNIFSLMSMYGRFPIWTHITFFWHFRHIYRYFRFISCCSLWYCWTLGPWSFYWCLGRNSCTRKNCITYKVQKYTTKFPTTYLPIQSS